MPEEQVGEDVDGGYTIEEERASTAADFIKWYAQIAVKHHDTWDAFMEHVRAVNRESGLEVNIQFTTKELEMAEEWARNELIEEGFSWRGQ